MGTCIMASTASEYRLYAQDCLRWAEETADEEHRQAFLDMAMDWMRLAMHGP
jgi:hypothetical protein